MQHGADSGGAAEKDTPKTAAKTSGHGAIESLGSALMTGTIAGTIDDAQDFARVGQAEEQNLITPAAVVADVHAFFALTVGAHQDEHTSELQSLRHLVC